MNKPYEWVDQADRLKELVDQWLEQDFVAIDTEFVRVRTFFPIPGLIQVADAFGCYLVDPIEIHDTSSIRKLLEEEGTVKVLHACSEDVEIFVNHFKAKSRQLFDTQVAASVLGLGDSLGYAPLVEKLLSIEVSKAETRSNWIQRPLSDNQMLYAAQDVIHLYQVYLMQIKELRVQNRVAWVSEDSQRIVDANKPTDPQHYYLKIRQAWQMKGEKLWCLQQLASWREGQVRRLDIPRSFLIKDALMAEIASACPKTSNDLIKVKGIPEKFIRRYSRDILSITNQASDVDKTDYPERIPGPLKKEASYLFKSAKVFLSRLAEDIGIPASLISKKKEIESIVMGGLHNGVFQLTPFYTGWREDLVGAPLLKHLEDCYKAAQQDLDS